MKTTKKILLSLIIILIFPATSFGQGITLRQSNESGIYGAGETIKVTAQINGNEADTLSVKIIKNNIHTITDNKIINSGGEIIIFNESINEPASLIFEVRAENEFASLGAVVDPTKFTPGFRRPSGFDKYWNNEKEKLRSLPMEIKNQPVSNVEKGYICSDLETSCTGPKPARGYFAKPEKAEPGSLPIVLMVHAAGVKGDWCLSKLEIALDLAKMGQGTLAFDLNAHGMLNNQPPQYYSDLEEGELKNYWSSGIENRDDFYFRGMYLRLIRTLDFLTSQPEWDGKRILVIGESQGGGQALAVAGLDNRVTAVVAIVPAMCDWGGILAGRGGGWPDPFNAKADKEKMSKVLPYFDAAHILKDANATLVVEIGFIDYTCPSSSIYAAINGAKGKKIIYGVPYRGHHLTQPVYQKTWEDTVYKPRMDFINEFLR